MWAMHHRLTVIAFGMLLLACDPRAAQPRPSSRPPPPAAASAPAPPPAAASALWLVNEIGGAPRVYLALESPPEQARAGAPRLLAAYDRPYQPVAVEQALSAAALPPALASLHGLEVDLHAVDGKRCTARLEGFTAFLRARPNSGMDHQQWAKWSADELARAVWDSRDVDRAYRPSVAITATLGTPRGTCTGARVAVVAGRPAPRFVVPREAPAMEARALDAFRALVIYEEMDAKYQLEHEYEYDDEPDWEAEHGWLESFVVADDRSGQTLVLASMLAFDLVSSVALWRVDEQDALHMLAEDLPCLRAPVAVLAGIDVNGSLELLVESKDGSVALVGQGGEVRAAGRVEHCRPRP